MLNIPISKGKQTRAQRIVIYGPEGIGKSTLASSAPSPLFLDTEMGTGQLDVDRVEAYNFEQVTATINALLIEDHEYKTLVLDTTDNLKRYCEEAVMNENNWDSLEKPGYGKGFRVAFERFKLLIGLLDQLIFKGINVVNICHTKVLRITPPDSADYNKYCLKVSDSNKENDDSRLFLKEWSDCVLFCNYDTVVNSSQQKAVKHERVVHTTSSPAWEAKNRYGLPEAMPMTAETMQAIFQAAQGGAQQPAQVPAQAQVEEVPAQAPSPAQAQGYEQAAKREREVLTAFFVGTGKLQPGQTLEDLPANIAAALKARPQQALDRALAWCEQHGKEKKC
ncbi:MAG: AAA family ATPase [Oscillospiraceae bacterium]|nr:AAA family ATPase [Oscillospiraceae bacterium]